MQRIPAMPGSREFYGAVTISSFGENNHIYSNKVEILPFDLIRIVNMGFVNTEIQHLYFEIESFEQLFQSVDSLEERWIKMFLWPLLRDG